MIEAIAMCDQREARLARRQQAAQLRDRLDRAQIGARIARAGVAEQQHARLAIARTVVLPPIHVGTTRRFDKALHIVEKDLVRRGCARIPGERGKRALNGIVGSAPDVHVKTRTRQTSTRDTESGHWLQREP
jgi:hypothetical protein